MLSFKDFLNKPVSNVKNLSRKYNKSEKEMKDIVDSGIKVEKEHTSKKQVAKQIAMAHVGENPEYYEKLKKIEKTK